MGKNSFGRWMLTVVTIVLRVLGIHLRFNVLPPGRWNNRFAIDLLAVMLPKPLTTLILRLMGRSQEAKFELIWLNVRRLMTQATPVREAEIKCSPLLKWSITLMGTLLTLGLLWGCFHVPLDQQDDLKLAVPVITFFAFITVLCWVLCSRPAMRIGADGVGGEFSRLVPWEQIATCRVHSKRNALGEVSEPKVSVRGHDGRQIASFSLRGTPRDQRRDFLLALHFALLPNEEPPIAELDQVLARTGGLS